MIPLQLPFKNEANSWDVLQKSGIMVQVGFNMASGSPKMAKDPPEMDDGGVKLAPRGPQIVQDGQDDPKNVPR